MSEKRRLFEQVILESVPLVVKQNNALASFSSSNQLIIHDESELFPNYSYLFLHTRLSDVLSRDSIHTKYFRQMSIQDLTYLLPCILNANTYLNNSEYLEASKSRIDECKIAWKQISKCISSHVLVNPKNQLELIKNWSLVPVRQSSRLLLAPIKDCMFILKPTANLIIFNIFREIDLPLFDSATIPANLSIQQTFERIVVSLSKNEDLLRFFDMQKHRYEKIFTKDENKRNIFKELAKCVYNKWLGYKKGNALKFNLSSPDSISDTEIRRILKNLPIYEDLFGRFEALYNIKSYCIDISQLPTTIKENVFDSGATYYEDLLDFANSMKMHIMRKGTYSVFVLFNFHILYYIF